MKKCVLCDSKDYSKVYDFGELKYFKCNPCGLIKQTGEGETSYEEYHRDADYKELDDYLRNFFKKRYKIITKFVPKKGKILDVGSSTGVFLQVFKEKGWEVLGVEPSGSAKFAKKKGVETIKKPLEKVDLPDQDFKVAILNHTLEHLENPVKALQTINKALKSGGVIYIDVPNFASLESKIARREWRYLLPEEHTYQFTPETLEKVLETSGFEVVWQNTYSGIFGVDNPLFHFWYQLTSGKPYLYKNFMKDILSLPFDTLATVLNKGTSLMMIGRKIK